MGQKRKQPPSNEPIQAGPSAAIDSTAFSSLHHPEKPSAIALVSSSRKYSTSIAIPSSILLNAQTIELKFNLISQIARVSAIFNIDEIVVFEDGQSRVEFKPKGKFRKVEQNEEEEESSALLVRILNYLETPQYLRKALFPLHSSLRLVGILPPLDCPHHLRRDDLSPFREGVIVSQSAENRYMVDIGQWEALEVEKGNENVEIGQRVTVRMSTSTTPQLVNSKVPTLESGLYWGYKVRLATSLAAVFSESPYGADGGYDLNIGTSERGIPVEGILKDLEPFKHLLLAFGPLSGLELTIAADPLIPLGAEEASDLFDYWINVVEGQGSRTVRTEEALPIALARLKSTIERQGTAGTL